MYTKRTDDTIRVYAIKDPGEAEVYSDILTRRHYLGSAAYNRNTIVHVARRGREDVAILTWEAETRHRFGTRDRLIGFFYVGGRERELGVARTFTVRGAT